MATAVNAVPLAAVTGGTVDFAGDGVVFGVAFGVGTELAVRVAVAVGVGVGVGVGVAVGVAVGVGDLLFVARDGDGAAAWGAGSGGVAVAAPTRVSAMAIPSAPLAVALLLRRAQPMRPRIKARTATTKM
ncbi:MULTISPECIES: hypothetical protein [unclassified Knoellia]|uniref:hypothetical protein n=1 Tax=Knoellia altitudinis TaxID=3404795 RepID=UPI00361461BD